MMKKLLIILAVSLLVVPVGAVAKNPKFDSVSGRARKPDGARGSSRAGDVAVLRCF